MSKEDRDSLIKTLAEMKEIAEAMKTSKKSLEKIEREKPTFEREKELNSIKGNKLDTFINTYKEDYNRKDEIFNGLESRKKELEKITNELKNKQKKLKEVSGFIIKLENKKDKNVNTINSKYNEKNNFKNKRERFDFIFTEINSYFQEESGGDLYELLEIVNMFTKAISQGELLNLILQQKAGSEILEETILPILKLARDVALALKKQEDDQKKMFSDLINDDKAKNKNKIIIKEEAPEKTSLETIVINLTNILAAFEKTMRDLKNDDVSTINSLPGFCRFYTTFKNNFNKMS